MNLEDLLDMIDELLDRGMKLPGGRAVVDGEKLRSILDDIHLNMPQEIKQARGIVADRTEIISNAKKATGGTRASKWKAYYEFKKKYLIAANIKDRNNKILYSRDIDYGFAITAHKS